MKDDIVTIMTDELRELKKDKDMIDGFINSMTRIIAIAEASAPGNIRRNVPIKYGSDTANHLDDIIKASDKLKKALSFVNKDKELKIRLYPEFHNLDFDAVDVVNKIHLAAHNTKKYQSATGKEHKTPYHLRPEYKGKNVTSHQDIELLLILRGTVKHYFPEIQPGKNQDDKHPFFRLAAALLGMENPRRIINKIVSDFGT